MKTTDYKLIMADTNAELEKDVKSYLAEGWEIYGGPFFSQLGDGWLCQAMVLRK